MQNYQLTYIISDSLSEEEVKKTQEKIKKLLPGNAKEDFWGRKKLAYRIDKNDFGYYSTFSFEAETDTISPIQKKLLLSEDIIRFMITKTAKPAVAEKPATTDKPSIAGEPATADKKEKIKKTIETKKEAKAPTPQGVGIPTESVGKKPVAPKKATKKATKQKLTTEIESEEKKMEELDKKLDEILKE